MKRVLTVAILLLLIAAIGLKAELVRVPTAGPAQADQFDTRRALARLTRVLGDQQPHPVDSAEGDRVRDRLVAELRTLGLAPVITDDFVCNGSARSRTISCARVRNVLATVGPTSGRHVLLVSHYDSTPVGPGAADDGIGMAAMLETAAVLKDRPLRRPVTFLFNEGEEAGLLGARAFLQRNPLAGKVDALINLESRGTTGPAIMFETHGRGGEPVAHFARAIERPAANSLTTDFYRMIPNSTDVAVFKERPWTIVNFAVIGNETRYHSPGDTIAALDPRSLGHMGAQALALAADFARGEPVGRSGAKLYADLLGLKLVTLPQWLGLGILWAMLVGFAVLAWRRRGIAGAAGAVLLALAGAALAVFVLHIVVGGLRPGEFWRAHPALMSLAVDVTALATAAAALLWLGRRTPPERLRLAYWLVFLTIGAGLSLVAPGAAIYFLVPPLVAGAGLLAPRFGRAAALAAAVVLFLTWVPLLHLSQVLLDFDAAWVFGPISALILLPFLIELKPALAAVRRGPMTAALAAVGLVAWLPTLFAPAYSKDRKQKFSIEYVWDGEKRRAKWMVYHDGAALPSAFRAVGPFERDVEVPWSSYKRWSAPARGPAIATPALQMLGKRQAGRGRIVRFRLLSSGFEQVRLRAPSQARLRAVKVGGRLRRFGSGGEEKHFVLRCYGRSCDGSEFELSLGSGPPVPVTLIGIRSGLPREAQALAAARPGTAQPQYVPDATIAVTRVRL